MSLHAVAVAGENEALGAERSLEHVADRIEGRVVRARDDQGRKRGRSQLVERDLGFPRAALGDEGAGALLERRRERGGGIERRADRLEEHAEECFWVIGRAVRP